MEGSADCLPEQMRYTTVKEEGKRLLKLLIVDDERTTRNTLANHIPWRALGIGDIEQADDGVRALEIARRYAPDIVLTDIRMPRMDGLALARELRTCLPRSKVIILSAYSEVDYLKSAIKLNVVDYVEKPVDLDEVSRAVGSAVSACEEEAGRQTRRDAGAGWTGTVHAKPDAREERGAASAGGAVQEGGRLAADKAKRYIEQRACEPDFSINALASHLYLTPSYVCMIFKQEMGVTINHYQTSVRMERAKTLIADPAIKLHQLAALVGYSDVKYFARLFKKECGYTPSDYRRRVLS